MNRKKMLEVMSISVLTIPNLIYLIANGNVIKSANWVGLSMTSLLVLSIIGLGSLIHFKAKAGIWLAIIGVFVLVMSNISYVGGIALIIEGIALGIDGYLIRPLIVKEKIKELEANGKSVTYTRTIE